MNSRKGIIERCLRDSLTQSPSERLELFLFSEDEVNHRSIFECMIDDLTKQCTGFTSDEHRFVKKWIKKAGERYAYPDVEGRFDEDAYFMLEAESFIPRK